MQFPSHVAEMLTRLRAAGYEAYAVGGCVRDSMLGRVPHDWDAATSALPEETMAVFADPRYHVRGGNGLRHGTVTVSMADDPQSVCEITTFRTDGTYTDHRRPDAVTFVRHAEEDLARRDFTVNAMAAVMAENGEDVCFLDPYGGREDLEAGVIRCVGDPSLRFQEDALRILRGLRFAARYGFSVEEATGDAMIQCRTLLEHIAPERIGEEMRGFLAGRQCAALIRRFSKVIAQLFQQADPEADVDASDDPLIRIALLLHNVQPDDVRACLLRYGYGTEASDIAAAWIEEQAASLSDRPDLCRLADRFGRPDAARYFRFRRALACDDDTFLVRCAAETDALFAQGVCYNTDTLALRGRDLIRAGFVPGVQIGRLLSYLTERVIRGELPNDAAVLLDAARTAQPVD